MSSRTKRARIDARVVAASREQNFEGVLAETTSLLSGLTRVAGVVAVSKNDARLKQIDFVRLEAERVLAILVAEDGSVENRVLPVSRDLPALVWSRPPIISTPASGAARWSRRAPRSTPPAAPRRPNSTGSTASGSSRRASPAGAAAPSAQLIVRGQARVDLTALEELERVRLLFADLDTKTDVIDLLERAEEGEGVRIFIGSESKLFSLSGSSLIAAPLHDANKRIVGALGVIGPTRLNYARIVPMVEYTARVVTRVGGGG